MRRNFNFDGQKPADDLSDLTGYEEKYIMPIDSGAENSAPPAHTAADYTSPVRTAPPPEPQQAYAYGQYPAANGSVPNETYLAPLRTLERPLVFALKADSRIYIYEYSDRFEYYTRTDSGMLFRGADPKKR